MPLREASNQLACKCQVHNLFMYEYQKNDQRYLLPVITEHAHTELELPEGTFQFFRARATGPGYGPWSGAWQKLSSNPQPNICDSLPRYP